MKYSVITFGCRVNQADSLGFEEGLLAQGAQASSLEHADLVIVNTCSVTATADQGARQTIRRVARANPSARIVVTGCYATRRPDEIRALPNVAQIVTNDDKPQLVQLVRRSGELDRRGVDEGRHDLTTALRFGDGEGACGAVLEPGVAGRTAFTLRVQTGCDEACAYCIIPSTRGRPRSVPIEKLLREIDRVAGAGFKEVALSGVHLGSYGRDLEPRATLIDLLRAIAKVRLKADTTTDVPKVRLKADTTTDVPKVRLKADTTTDVRSVRLQADLLFRISSLEPMDCTREIVDLVASSDSIAPHFHLPLQHASNRILAAMRRPYTIEYYASLVDDIRARIPHASIGTDVIVGFPGETDADFESLASYLEPSPVTHVHVFPYSDRPGTAATAMDGKVHGAVVRERARRIREIGARLTARFRVAQVGTTHRALTIEDGSLAVTGNYLKLRIPPGRARNDWVQLVVTDTENAEVTDTWNASRSGVEGDGRKPLPG